MVAMAEVRDPSMVSVKLPSGPTNRTSLDAAHGGSLRFGRIQHPGGLKQEQSQKQGNEDSTFHGALLLQSGGVRASSQM
jgi:hypothetical protein